MRDSEDIFRRFSPGARKILLTSQQVADSLGSGIGSEHLLIAIAMTSENIAHEILKEYAITIEQIRLVLALNKLTIPHRAGMTDEAKHAVQLAFKTAAMYRHDQIDPEHLLLSITSLRESRGYQVIARLGVDPEHIRRQIETMLATTADLQTVIEPELEPVRGEYVEDHDDHFHSLGSQNDHLTHNHPRPLPEPSTPIAGRERKAKVLETFTTDLVALAKAGKLDAVIGRKEEITRTIHVLSRRTKNNPILIGAPGVGKTAIVEGLAQRIALGEIPANLADRRILRLDLSLLVAGTMYRGQFEERLKKLMAEIERDPRVIIFIDEIHTVIGTGSAEGSLDAANILKPALSRGQLRVIGATTLDDYRRSIEKDQALERRFQTVLIPESSAEETVAILTGLREAYQDYHRVTITNEVIQTIVRLADRYLFDRFFPDKAIDILDEAAAAKQLGQPNHGQKEQQHLAAQLARLATQKERAIEREAFTQAASLREKEKKLDRKLRELSRGNMESSRPSLTDHDVAEVVSRITRIPLVYLLREGTLAPDELQGRLEQRLVGQSAAIRAVVAAIHRAKARLAPLGRPLGSFLFLGPTGVGKTELARLLAEEVFGTPEAFIKLDMSEFMERHTASRLVGAPAGYVGYDDGGKLTDLVRRRPHSLLLLDEIEKAHPDFQNLLLQILEDGYLSDAKGGRVNFSQTILILTSNLGSDLLNQAQAIGFHQPEAEAATVERTYQETRERVMTAVRDFFRPEFLNRLDQVMTFNRLIPAHIRTIVDLQLGQLVTRLAEEGYRLTVTPQARQLVAERGFDHEFGARPIRRLLTEWLETPLAELILSGGLAAGGEVTATPTRDRTCLAFRTTRAKPALRHAQASRK